MACMTSSWFAPQAVTSQAVARQVVAGAEMAGRSVTTPDPAVVPSDGAIASRAFADWLRARLPKGGRVEEAGEAVDVVHTVGPEETALSIAKAYLDVTDVYRAKDLAAAIVKEVPELRLGAEVRIPHLIAAPLRSPDEDRKAWPSDRALKGIYLTGGTAGTSWPEFVERARAHGLNAIVVDAKDYGGAVTYPTQVELARASGAGRTPPIPDFSRAIRFAHQRDVSVIVRVTCFHDPWMARYAPRLAVQSSSGGSADIGWLDPASAEAQDYLVDLVKEVVSLGADEVQLDYVRFPVQDTAGAAMLPRDGHRTKAIASFVARVHEATQAHGVPLSLDVFGIAASAPRADVEALGQDVLLLGPVAEAISPMVYPSHYPVGSLGFEQPGDHPELVGYGTNAAVVKLAGGNVSGTIVRPWLQAAAFRTTEFGPKYIQDEIRSAEANGATGWLMWDAGNSYWAVWRALPVVDEAGEGTYQSMRVPTPG
jgi:hypothetical protein